MSVHDALEAWAEGRLPIERALDLTGAADVGELLILCYQCEVPRPLITARPESVPDSVASRLQAIADQHSDAECEVAGGGYSPESIRVLAGMEPRPEGVTIGVAPEFWWASIDGVGPEPVALWRDAGASEDPPQLWGAERVGHEGVLWPDRVRLIARAIPPGGRIALRAEDISDDEMAGIMASKPAGPDYSLDDLSDDGVRYPSEDGPGASGPRVELAVRVMVGTERSTVIVADAVTGRAVANKVVAHGDEARAAAAAVERAFQVGASDQPPS